MIQESSNLADSSHFGWIIFTFCVLLSTFARPITHRNLGERILRLYIIVGVLFLGFMIVFCSCSVFYSWDKKEPIGMFMGKYFCMNSWMRLDVETGLVFVIIGFLCSGLQILDLWRSDLTYGTYILSTSSGKPRLPVGNYEIFFYWLIPSSIALLFHLYGSSILFFFVFITKLFIQISMESAWRYKLLSQRDGHLLQESIDQNEINVTGLRAALHVEEKFSQGAINHANQNSDLH